MSKVNVIYHAPAGDNQVVETRGQRFFDGQATPIDSETQAELLAKLRTNPLFEVDEPEAKPDAGKDAKRPM